MTEKKPGEPDGRDREVVESFPNTECSVAAPCYGFTQQQFLAELALIAAYREEIESRARREGAREALERAAKVAFDVVFNLDNEPEGLADAVAQAIRALADQPEAEGKRGVLETFNGQLVEDMTEPPAKADALSLGHEFVPSCYDESGDWCAALVPFDACGQPEAAHGRK